VAGGTYDWESPECVEEAYPEVKAQYETAKAALQKHFELESKRELYAVEFQTTLY